MWYTSVFGKAGLSYDFDENHSIGMTYGCFGELYGGGYSNGSQTIYCNGQLEGEVKQWMKVDHRTIPNHDANIYYVGKIGKLGIDFNGTWLWYKNIRRDIETERSTELENRDIHSNAEDRNRMLAAKLVLSYPVWKGELSIGSETTSTHSNGMSENIEGWVPASETHIKENNLAGFAEYEVQLGHWSLNAGLRYEHVSANYESLSIRNDKQLDPSRTYNDLFPSLSAGWQKDKWGLQLSYTKRVNRPSYRSLSNFVQYDNRYMVEGGNPMLRPAIRQDIDFSATYSWLSFSAGFEHYNDKMLFSSSIYQQGKDIIMARNENFDHFNCCHASIVASPKWGIYTPTLTLSYFQQFFDVRQYGIDHSLTKPEWTINLRNWLKLGKTAKAMVYIHYATTHDYGFNRKHHQFNVNARLQKTFLKGQLNAILFANDIFRTLRDKWEGCYPTKVLTRDAYEYSREIGISLQYNFNQKRSKYKGTGAGNDEKGRL
jgi:Outer membrane receptor for Fe3+-dicitrate